MDKDCSLCRQPTPRRDLQKRIITRHGQPCVGLVCPGCNENERVAA